MNQDTRDQPYASFFFFIAVSFLPGSRAVALIMINLLRRFVFSTSPGSQTDLRSNFSAG